MIEQKTVSFVSSQGNGMMQDLAAIKKYLTIHEPEMSFRYFFKSEQGGSKMARIAASSLKKRFTARKSHMICADLSISELGERDTDEKRILIASDYDFQFERVMSDKRKMAPVSLESYTHVFSGTPFTTRVLNEYFDLTGVDVVEGATSPFAWALCQKEREQELKRNLYFYHPQAEGKRIIALITSAKGEIKEAMVYRKLMELDLEDSFILTNNLKLYKEICQNESNHEQFAGYCGDMMVASDVLYIADVLITNRGGFAVPFSFLSKPFYWIEYSQNGFERFMKSLYPELNFQEQCSQSQMFSYQEKHKKFAVDFRNEEKGNPLEVVRGILQTEAHF